MGYNAPNYTEQGGSNTVIGGTITVTGTLDVSAGTIAGIPEATPTVEGTVKQSANVADAAGETPTAAEYNALLAALIAAGIMADAE